ncbi:MAG: 50S ribosomal protein L25/general stress protein Ctc [Bacteroidales bacterium]|jgi:large subunit ribosomal protein L25|nr:50S ribosomal protein L25/general stress protein Ctc [Bacteroidales bacterium]
MKSLVLKGQLRENLGKKDAKKLRAQELIPSVMYGSDEIIHFAVPFSELRQLVYTPSSFIASIDIDGKIYKAIMQDIQWHPVEEQVLHVDFLRINEGHPVKMEVPVNVVGLAKGIKAGGKLKTNMRKLKIKALAEYLPDTIDIDVTSLDLGQSIKVSNLKLENVELLDSKSNIIVTVSMTRAARSATNSAVGESEDTSKDTVS